MADGDPTLHSAATPDTVAGLLVPDATEQALLHIDEAVIGPAALRIEVERLAAQFGCRTASERPHRDRPPQRPRDGARVAGGDVRRLRRAAEPQVPRRRVPLLPRRSHAAACSRSTARRPRLAPRRPTARSSSTFAATASVDRPDRPAGHRRSARWICRATACGPTIRRWCCTRRARRRGRRSCRCASATSPRRPATSPRRLQLTPADRSLNVMPLFHIHGIMAGVAGAAVGRRVGGRARPASTPSSSIAGSTSSSRPSTQPCRRCIRWCWRAARRSRGTTPRCASCARRRPRCRRRCWTTWRSCSTCPSSRPTA